MLSGAMVVTVGTNPVPVLLTVCQHELSAVWLVHSSGDDGTASYAYRIAEVLGKHRPEMTVQLLDIGAAPGDFAAVRAELARPRADPSWPPPAPWRCDYTGGTAVMSVEVVTAHVTAHGLRRADLRSYWDEVNGRVRYDHGVGEPGRVPEFFDLVTIARLHGFARTNKACTFLDVQDARWAENLCRLAHAVAIHGREPDDLTGLSATHVSWVRQLHCTKEASGYGLELVVAALLVRAGHLTGDLPRPDEVVIGFEAAPAGGACVEVDIIARYGQQVLVVSCKNTSYAAKYTAAAAGKVYQEAQALFGGATRRMLVTALAKPIGATGESHPVARGFTDLLLGPGLTWRSPHVLTDRELRRMLDEVTATPGRAASTPELDRVLRHSLGLARSAQRPGPVPMPAAGPFSAGLTLVTTLSGNALATVASGRGLAARHVVVLEASGRDITGRHRWTGELQQAIGVVDATVDPVPVDMSDVPALTSTIGEVIDQCEHPVVIDVTGGTKAVSVAGHLAASAAGRSDVRVCYSDIRTSRRRWLDGRSDELAESSTDIERLLTLSDRRRGTVDFRGADLDGLAASRYRSEQLVAAVIRRLTGGPVTDAVLVRPTLWMADPSGQERDWLPRCLVLVTGSRVIGLYAHGKLTSMQRDGKLGAALFVDALVAASGGDIARSVFVTDQDRDRDFERRLRSLVRRPFPPRVLWRSDAEGVINDDAKLAELVEWMTA